MASQFFQCPNCRAANAVGSRFCSHCGTPFAAPAPQAVPKKQSFPGWAIALIACVGLCGICGAIGNLADKNKTTVADQSAANAANQPAANLPPAAPTPPLTLAELKAKAQPLLKMPDRAEYTADELKPFDEVMKPLREITKESKDYKEAQKLFDQLNKKLSVFLAEIVVLGPKPINSAYDGNVTPAQNYLKQALNDYDSSEYLGWTDVRKTYVGKEPFWTTTVRLRAKNAFGAFVVNEYTFFIRNNQVVNVEK